MDVSAIGTESLTKMQKRYVTVNLLIPKLDCSSWSPGEVAGIVVHPFTHRQDSYQVLGQHLHGISRVADAAEGHRSVVSEILLHDLGAARMLQRNT